MRYLLRLFLFFAFLVPIDSQAQDKKLIASDNDNAVLTSSSQSRADCVDGMAEGFECQNVNFIARVDRDSLAGNTVNDMWGWVDPNTNDMYAIVGREDGTAFVNITDTENPVVVANLPKTDGSFSATWRDIKVHNNHAYIVADGAGEHGVQILNLAKLRDFAGTRLELTADAMVDSVSSAHNIVINEESGFAYVVGSNKCGGGLYMLDLSDPLEPIEAGCAIADGTGRAGTGYIHDAQCVMYNGPDTEHQGKEICFSANELQVAITDVTDKAAPVTLSITTYPTAQYIHQGWLNPEQTHFITNDELDENRNVVTNTTTFFWNVMDLDDPIVETEFESELGTIDHNLYVKDNLVFQSNYTAGLRILNITDVKNPIEVGYFDTFPNNNNTNFNGTWSNYPFFGSDLVLVSDGTYGLFILEAPSALLTSNEDAPSINNLKLVAYPSPAQDYVSIELPISNGSADAKLSVVDIQGRIVSSVIVPNSQLSASTRSIDISEFSPGKYIVVVEQDNQIYSTSIVKSQN